MLITILSFLVTISILVTIHEFGHFYIARRCGVKVLRFSVGFGKPLITWKDRLGTEFVVAAIPLGGFVKMLDEREGEVAAEEQHQSFNSRTVYQKMAIVLAGPVANFILAIFLYFILAMIGTTGIAPILGELPRGGIADEAGLGYGDEIVAIDNHPVMVWREVFDQLVNRIGDSGDILFEVRDYDSSVVESPTRTIRLPIEDWLHEGDQPDFFADLGIVQYVPKSPAIIQRVQPDGAASKARLKAGDVVKMVNGVAIDSWRQWVMIVQENPGNALDIIIEREAQGLSIILIPDAVERDGKVLGFVGAATTLEWPEGMIRPIEYSFVGAIAHGFTKTWERVVFILSFTKKLIFAEVSTKNLGGSLTIAQVAGDSFQAGLLSYLGFLAFLSVSLGVVNLLPIPVLDGGHFLFYTIEAIKGSPVSESIQLVAYQVGLLLVVGVMILAHVNDFLRIFAS